MKLFVHKYLVNIVANQHGQKMTQKNMKCLKNAKIHWREALNSI